MNLICGVKVTKGASESAIVIETNKGRAKLTVAVLEEIVALNIKEGTYIFGASRKIHNFLIMETP